MVQLDPATYECSVCRADLTSQVHELLEEKGPPVAFDPAQLFRRRPRERPFELVIPCRGGHPAVVTGRFTP